MRNSESGNPASDRPAITNVDPAVLSFRFTQNCDIAHCKGQCCRTGIWMRPAEAARILAHKEAVAALMDATQNPDFTQWFEEPASTENLAHLEAKGKEIASAVHNHKCVFLDAIGACALQKLAMKEGKHRWAYKPYHCVLFPFLVEDGTLSVDLDHGDNIRSLYHEEFYCDHRGKNATALGIEVCREELRYALGSDHAYDSLCRSAVNPA
ncbi:MAG: DUF3109 family protein [Fibrobacterota bacterium]